MIQKLIEEDRVEINALQETILRGLVNLNLINVIQELVYPVRIGKEALKKDIKDKGKYFFMDDAKFMLAMRQFFTSDYLAQRLARQVYVYEEGETFSESLSLPNTRTLGKVLNSKGDLEDTNTIEIEFEGLAWYADELDQFTQLPVKVKAVRLVPSDEVAKAKKEEEEYTQLSIFDLRGFKSKKKVC